MSNRRERILSAADIKSQIVVVEAWSVDVEVRGLTGAQRERVIQGTRDEEGKVDDTKLTVPLLIASVHDPETKQPLFTEADRDALNGKSAAVLDQVVKVALRLSGLDEKTTEELRKNSSGTPSDGSTSA